MILVFLFFNSCGIILKDNYFSEKNHLDVPSLELSKYNTENLDKSDIIKEKLKFDNLPTIASSSVILDIADKILFENTANLLDLKINLPNLKDLTILDKDTLPSVTYQSLPNVTISEPIKKPFPRPKIPLLD